MISINEEIFHVRYNKLNEEQKLAVETIEGAVMVIAGPGTGKTEVLSLRIANLLRSDMQVEPHEILCLTYTDEATNSMRKRLVDIIGTAAHKVNIFTFHAFCNNIIQNYSDYFSKKSLQPITDLELNDILYDMIDELPKGHVLRRLSGEVYYDVPLLKNLFNFMKKEYFTTERMVALIDIYIEDLSNRDEYVYKRNGNGFKKGDLKQTQIDEAIKKVEKTKAAAKLFEVFENKMKEMGRYDFNDMIIWVLKAFNDSTFMLQRTQERYHHFLVDEFQDTNGAQNELLKFLANYWNETPNVFVVGDDDQSIYEFQGARIKNITDFYERYKKVLKTIVLTKNYRSSQSIIDKSTATIVNNGEKRLIDSLKDLQLNKNIVAANERWDKEQFPVPIVKAYHNILHEEADIVLQLEALYQQGVNLKEVAVLYAQHKQADNIIALMERKGIPYSVKKAVNILDLPLVQQLIAIFRYLEIESKTMLSGDALLFEIIHSPYFGIKPTDIALLSLHMQQNKSKDKANAFNYWRLTLANALLLSSLQLETTNAMIRFGVCVENWLQQMSSLTLPMLLEKIMYDSGLMGYNLHSKDHVWNVQVLHTFFNFVRESFERNPRISLTEFLAMIDRMKDEGIALPLQKTIRHENGVQFFTAHSSKGNEFEHVFLIGCTKEFWEAKKGVSNMYFLPDTITNTREDADIDKEGNKIVVARRLFYVAMTRAKKFLHISYALKDNAGKELSNSLFVDEIRKKEEKTIFAGNEDDLVGHLEWAMRPVAEVYIDIANKAYISQSLANFNMSASSLSSYLNCPVSFYFEKVLKVPFLKNDSLAFGSAVHSALEKWFKNMKENKGFFPPKEELIKAFEIGMYKEREAFTALQYERRMEQGHALLSDYYDKYQGTLNTDVLIEMNINRFLLEGIPVTGKIDKIEKKEDGYRVVDYKTGKSDNAKKYTHPPNDADPKGGAYWRQMVFYKLLLENMPDTKMKVSSGMFDYLEKDKNTGDYKRIIVPMTQQDELLVKAQIKETYARIMNHEFDKGCGDEKCRWCNFAKKYELAK